MKLVRHFSLFLFLLSTVSLSYAALYRHIPFTLKLHAHETLIVDYNFAEKNGLRCTSTEKLPINFKYKGHEKSSTLPVILQSAHVPNEAHEELADAEGQFSIHADKMRAPEAIVKCNYLPEEANVN